MVRSSLLNKFMLLGGKKKKYFENLNRRNYKTVCLLFPEKRICTNSKIKLLEKNEILTNGTKIAEPFLNLYRNAKYW